MNITDFLISLVPFSHDELNDILPYFEKENVQKNQVLIKEGQVLERKHFMDLEKILNLATRMLDIGGHKIPVANVPYQFASDAGNVLCKGHSFAGTYYDTETERVFSLRSHPDGEDVSKIALQYGGGGHRNASGFKVRRDHILAKS